MKHFSGLSRIAGCKKAGLARNLFYTDTVSGDCCIFSALPSSLFSGQQCFNRSVHLRFPKKYPIARPVMIVRLTNKSVLRIVLPFISQLD